MDLDRFLNLLCAVFGAIGSWYVLKTATELSPDLIAVLSRTNWGFSLAQIDALSQQKADSIVGTLLIAIALVFAVIAAVAPPGIRLFKKRVVAIGIAFAAASAGYAFCYVLGSAIQRDQKLAAGRYIEKHELQTLFSRGRLQKNELITLRENARSLLGMTVEDSERPRSLIGRVADEVRLEIPRGFDFSEVETSGKQ